MRWPGCWEGGRDRGATKQVQTRPGRFNSADSIKLLGRARSSTWGSLPPGAKDLAERQTKIEALVAAGARVFVNLMEEDETNWTGERFEPYDDLAQAFCAEVSCCRYPVQDLSIPSRSEMETILTAIDNSILARRPTYVHCWGGVGRTGTVTGCWLLRHGLAEPTDVLRVLAELRRQDRERGARISPETAEQQRFVRQWLT